ncbi:MAG: c-type cytochrome [Betaproteobacteria bacterium]|nr:c-type cytochrome [Betaproteobacteria bacterium]
MLMKTRSLMVAAGAAMCFSGTAFAAGNPAAKAMMMSNDCFSCHAVNHQLVGPSFRAIAQRYHGRAASTATIATLAKKVISGGSGHWNAQTGGMAMTPHPQLSQAQAEGMVRWVLAQ